MHGFLASVRYCVRLLLKSPGFAVTAVLILGFGIGANTAIFSLIDSVLLKPPRYPHPDRMVDIFMPSEGASDGFFDYPDFLDYVASQHSRERTQGTQKKELSGSSTWSRGAMTPSS